MTVYREITEHGPNSRSTPRSCQSCHCSNNTRARGAIDLKIVFLILLLRNWENKSFIKLLRDSRHFFWTFFFFFFFFFFVMSLFYQVLLFSRTLLSSTFCQLFFRKIFLCLSHSYKFFTVTFIHSVLYVIVMDHFRFKSFYTVFEQQFVLGSRTTL